MTVDAKTGQPIFSGYSVGLNNVGSDQSSGAPYLTSSVVIPANSSEPIQIAFPKVTKFIIVRNETGSTGDVRVGFSANGVKGTTTNNFVRLAVSESFSADYRVSSIYLRSDGASTQKVSIIAGLTNIDVSHLASNWSGSNGVG